MASNSAAQALTLGDSAYVVNAAATDRLALASSAALAPIIVASEDHAGVVRVAGHLQADIRRVTGTEPLLLRNGQVPAARQVVMVGTLGKSAMIDGLVAAGKIDVSDIVGHWEASLIQVVEQPFAGIERALVIVGSDKRGTIYGMFDVSAQIGVSPWYYWADVPVPHQNELHVLPVRRVLGSPAVKYRGIFINDEQPALSAWASAQFGGFNSKFYDRLFELMLRLRANYLWPAMWGRAFNLDDSINPSLADEYGIVMGTSHHEPMMRNQDEWRRAAGGDWNYTTNQAALSKFWEEGIRRMGSRESIVTVGMRGDGDVKLSPNPDIPLLQSVLAGQRAILANVTGKEPSATPQVWTIYKEVQDYYEQGMRAPDDVTVMLADDNFGNIRKLPTLGEPIASGGFGIYYHFDYVGSPRSYKWINTNSIPRIWEQMHLAYDYGVDRIWMVNVGDLKLLELPTQFFLDYAWDPKRITSDKLGQYTDAFAAQQFGVEHASAIAEILNQYAKFNSRRKPELLAPETYSLVNYREADLIVEQYRALSEQAVSIGQTLPSEYQAAYQQLVLYPVQASANLNELYVTVARNRLFAKQGRASTNRYADRAVELFARDAELSSDFNHKLSDGKWNHIADQTHIGYVTWQEPSKNAMPELSRISAPVPAEIAVAVEGSDSAWPGNAAVPTLPEFHPYQYQPSQFIEVFNRGQTPFEFSIDAAAPYVVVTPATGSVQTERRVWISIDWANAPAGVSQSAITVHGPDGASVSVQVPLNHWAPAPAASTPIVEQNGYVAMDADQFSRKVDSTTVHWETIADLSRTSSGVTAFPVTAAPETPNGTSPRLEYDVHLIKGGQVRVRVFVSPTLNFVKTGLKYAVSFDDQTPKTFNIHGDGSDSTWQERVSNNVNATVTNHTVDGGLHVLKFWLVNPGIVVQKLVIETGNVRPSYLGPPTAPFVEPSFADAPYTAGNVAAAGASGSAGTAGAGGASATSGDAASAGASGADAAFPEGNVGGIASRHAPSRSQGELAGGGCNVSARLARRRSSSGLLYVFAFAGSLMFLRRAQAKHSRAAQSRS